MCVAVNGAASEDIYDDEVFMCNLCQRRFEEQGIHPSLSLFVSHSLVLYLLRTVLHVYLFICWIARAVKSRPRVTLCDVIVCCETHYVFDLGERIAFKFVVV